MRDAAKVVVAVVFTVLVGSAGVPGHADSPRPDAPDQEGVGAAWFGGHQAGFEVWMADQSDTRPGYGGQLLIYDGAHLRGRRAAAATPNRPARSGWRHRGPVPGLDRPEPGAPAHDPVQSPAVPRGPVVRGQRPRGGLRRRVANAAQLHRDDHRHHRHETGARRLPGARRLLHPGRQSERQTARAHRHQLRDQHVHAQPRCHARPGDVHDAEWASRASTRTCGRSTGRSARSSIPSSTLRLRDPPRRRALRGRCQDARRCPSSPSTTSWHGARQRVWRHRGRGRTCTINSGGSPVNVSSGPIRITRRCTASTSTASRCPGIRRRPAQQPGADAAADQERHVRFARVSSASATGISGRWIATPTWRRSSTRAPASG